MNRNKKFYAVSLVLLGVMLSEVVAQKNQMIQCAIVVLLVLSGVAYSPSVDSKKEVEHFIADQEVEAKRETIINMVTGYKDYGVFPNEHYSDEVVKEMDMGKLKDLLEAKKARYEEYKRKENDPDRVLARQYIEKMNEATDEEEKERLRGEWASELSELDGYEFLKEF